MLTPPYDPVLDDLRALLWAEYGDGKRVNLAKKRSFVIDDRQPRDYDAQKKLFLWFCAMDVTADSPDEVCLHLRGGVPWSDVIAEWLECHGAVVRGEPVEFVSLKINSSNTERLEELAGLIEAVLRRGRRYEVAAWKYVVPRTASSLRRLRSLLSTWWQRRQV